MRNNEFDVSAEINIIKEKNDEYADDLQTLNFENYNNRTIVKYIIKQQKFKITNNCDKNLSIRA